MFDYQAGEKFKLTLILVGFAGLMAGVFFTMLLMPPQEAPKVHQRPKWMSNPDGGGRQYNAQASPMAMPPTDGAGGGRQSDGAAPQAPTDAIAPEAAKSLIVSWLPLVYDLNAATARANQDKAIAYMTPECAQAYRQNVWTADLAKTIEEKGLRSSFRPIKLAVGQTRPDGSIEIFVEGEQTLLVPGQSANAKTVKSEFLVKMMPEGPRVAGIEDGGG